MSSIFKGGVVALAACGIGLKKADKYNPHYDECKDLIQASVVHACQDHNQVSFVAIIIFQNLETSNKSLLKTIIYLACVHIGI